MEFQLPKKYLSASAISTFLRCPLQYKFRYIDQIIIPPNMVLLKGKALHSGFELYYSDIISGNTERLPAEGIAELTLEKMEEEAEENGIKIDGESKDEAAKEFTYAADSYINNVGCWVNPKKVEQEVWYVSRCGVPILGYVDLIRKPNEEEGTNDILADYKLTGKKWNINQLKNSLQFNIYSMATEISNIEIHNIVRGSKPPKKMLKKTSEGVNDLTSNLRVLSYAFDNNDSSHIENMIESVAMQITSGIFPPCDLDAWCCNENWCGYWHLCRGEKH